MTPTPPPVLLERLRTKQCVIFAGAGLAAAANLPSWPELIKDLIGELHSKDPQEIEELNKLMAQGKLLDVADYCQEKLGSKRFRRFMVERFGGRHEIPPVYRQIAKLPLSGVVTTNYDKLFEAAYEGRLKVRTHADPNLASLAFDAQPFLLKAHGDIDEPENLVLTARDYQRLIHSNPQIKYAFNWVMFGHAILFAGYSLKDPDFNLWLDGYKEAFGETGNRFALLSGVGPVEQKNLRRIAGIEVLSYPEGRHETVEQFIAELVGTLVGARAIEITPYGFPSDGFPGGSAGEEAKGTFLLRIAQASAPERARLLARPSPREVTALQSHHGDEGWLQIRRQSLAQVRRSGKKRGAVIVIPDLFESELVDYDSPRPKSIWLNFARLVIGDIERLRVREDGSSEHTVRAVGIVKRWYAELLLSLSQNWNAHAFWYDWRLDFNESAGALNARIEEWLGKEPIAHIIAHGAGGMIARAFIKNHPERWEGMLDRKSEIVGASGGRLVMLGSSQRGSLTTPQLLTGTSEMLRKLAVIDLVHDLKGVRDIFNSWPGLYQMLPSPIALRAFELFYQAESYGDIRVSQRHLDSAFSFHKSLHEVVDPSRMSLVLSDKQIKPTVEVRKSWNLSRQLSRQLDLALAGEPRAANQLAQLTSTSGEAIPTYYVQAKHGHLPSDEKVIGALDDLLETGVTFSLREATNHEVYWESDPLATLS